MIAIDIILNKYFNQEENVIRKSNLTNPSVKVFGYLAGKTGEYILPKSKIKVVYSCLKSPSTQRLECTTYFEKNGIELIRLGNEAPKQNIADFMNYYEGLSADQLKKELLEVRMKNEPVVLKDNITE
ncbi:hypothetical protein [Namhaeicola litoreus]|uniref:Uncharacterized protein n=1 Tax=Namhaeicola litoreus TaxID=1052145 RepID=A0ABW3Y1A1_9FLAO